MAQNPKNIKWKKYCNKFNTDFKNGPHFKKKLTHTKGLTIEVRGTAAFRGLIGGESAKEAENQQPGIHRMKTRKTCCQRIPSQTPRLSPCAADVSSVCACVEVVSLIRGVTV